MISILSRSSTYVDSVEGRRPSSTGEPGYNSKRGPLRGTKIDENLTEK